MAFSEHVPPPDLAAWVDRAWISDVRHPETAPTSVLPDACAEVVVAVRGGVRVAAGDLCPTVAVFGLGTRPMELHYETDSLLVGVRLSPAGILRLFGDTLRPLVDGAGDAAQALPAFARRLADTVEDFARTGASDAMLAALRSALPGVARVDPRLERAAARLFSTGGVDVRRMADETGVSTRQLDRWFDRHFGVAPKLLGRIARFRAAFEEGMRAQRGDWAAIAARHGYADQSHLTRDFVAFAGRPPERQRLALRV